MGRRLGHLGVRRRRQFDAGDGPRHCAGLGAAECAVALGVALLIAAPAPPVEAAIPQAPTVLPQIWGVELTGSAAADLDRRTLRRLKGGAITLVAPPGGSARKLQAITARWRLPLFQPRRVAGAQAASAVCDELRRLRPGSRCAILAGSAREAAAIARVADIVAVRVRGARAFVRLARAGGASRVVGIADLRRRGYRARRWRAVIRAADRSPVLDLVVRPGGRGAPAALACYLGQVRALSRGDRRSPSRPGAPRISSADGTGVTLSWSPSKDNRLVAGYALYRDGRRIARSRRSSARLRGFGCTSHLVEIDAYDKAGSRSAKSFTRLPPSACGPGALEAAGGAGGAGAAGRGLDSAPPSAPANLNVLAATQASVTLSWSPSTDDAGVKAYRVYRDGTLAGTTAGTTMWVGSLACATLYTFGVEAVDAGGNASARTTVTASTSVCVTPPPDEPAASRFVVPGGSDGGSCSREAPCGSFARAYGVAGAGEVVEVAAGSYPAQVLLAVEGRSGPNVVFRPQAGARVVLGGLSFGSGEAVEGPDFVTVRGMETAYRGVEPGAGNQEGIWVGPGSTHVTLEDMDAGSVDSWFADHLTVRGGDFGPCDAVWGGGNVCGNSKQDASSNVLIDGATFHDYRFDESCFTDGADCHWECMYVNAGVNVTIRNSRFRNCAIFDIFTTISGPDAAAIGHRNLKVYNNFFAAPWTETPEGGSASRATALSLAWCQNSEHGYQDVFVGFNSFQSNTTLQIDANSSCRWENVRVVGNLLSYDGGCQDRWSFAYNVWSTAWRTGSCDATDRIHGPVLPYVNDSPGAALDYHLAAASAADGLVPVSAGCPATDIDGHARPTTGTCDAGADER